MSALRQKFTREEIIKGMTDLGIPRDRAERQANLECGVPFAWPEPSRVVPTTILPLRFTLPWSALVSDNAKYAPASGRTGRPKIILRPEYRAAKSATKAIGRAAMGSQPPLAYPLGLTARVWVPHRLRGFDVCNFAKCCHDALQQVVYTNDSWLYDTRWIRMGEDIDQPRAELTISRYLEGGV